MTKKVEFSFETPATLGHVIGATGTFTGTAERGRATRTLGTGAGQVRVAAPFLGDWANVVTFEAQAGAGATEDFDFQAAPDPRYVVRSRASGTAAQMVSAINAFRHLDPHSQHHDTRKRALAYAKSRSYGELLADLSDGDGTDPAPVGSGLLTGGAAPTSRAADFAEYVGDTNAGLFVFDAPHPIVLKQFAGNLSGSVAWTLKLVQLSGARAVAGTQISLAGQTSQSVVVTSPIIIHPGWGLSFAASAQGSMWATVAKA